jgi:hypothetical protein
VNRDLAWDLVCLLVARGQYVQMARLGDERDQYSAYKDRYKVTIYSNRGSDMVVVDNHDDGERMRFWLSRTLHFRTGPSPE